MKRIMTILMSVLGCVVAVSASGTKECSSASGDISPLEFYLGDITALDPIIEGRNGEPGSMKSWLAGKYDLYSLKISGTINADDFQAMWNISLKGNLRVIDLSEAEIDDGVIPAGAFWNESEQKNASCDHINYIRLRKIILPKNTKVIGENAFANAVFLDEVVFPEGLETIGANAFYNCALREVDLPATCVNFDGEGQFRLNLDLERISLPEGVESIPPGFVRECIYLKDIVIPSTVKHIGGYAFYQCRSLKSLALSPVLETIGEYALWGMDGIEKLIFPASLKSLGVRCCEYMTWARRIYCAAVEPPLCHKVDINFADSDTPFGHRGTNFHLATPEGAWVYVPKGTADKYRNAWGWHYFTVFIETDEFPDASVGDVIVDSNADDGPVYDLQGRPVLNPQEGHLYIRKGQKIIYKIN
ncbi:MAG: leucine-rich repeat domain-containing protein [Muribaculaceae bacterium]|nr:leucine-rich repeat domain-containing protein [Muribaculaceae bacterium]